MLDMVKAFGDVGIQDILRLAINAEKDLLNSILTGTPRPKAIAVGFKVRFPLGFQSQSRQCLFRSIANGRDTLRTLHRHPNQFRDG